RLTPEAAPSPLRRSHPTRPPQEGAGQDHRLVGDHRTQDQRAPRPLLGCARKNLDDSLKHLSNAADIYEHTDDANRRLLKQTLFKAIYIDEDNDVRVGYRNPYDGLSVEGLQADALIWAAEAKSWARPEPRLRADP
ncbi:hypothetical protein O3790_10845, partial [Micrococcus luteus]